MLFSLWRRAGIPPVLTSLNYGIADIDGGSTITITGTSLSGATLCTLGSTSCTITANTDTSLTFTTPARSPGTYNVQVTTAGGLSNALLIEVWSPGSLPNIEAYLDSRKGLTLSGNDVLAWEDQAQLLDFESVSTSRPLRVAGVFGAHQGIRFTQSDYVGIVGAARSLDYVAGCAIFCIANYTATAAASTYVGNAPLTVVGDATNGVNFGFGFTAGSMIQNMFNAGWTTTTRGSGLNDGTTRLLGFTHENDGAFANELKMYSGATQQGATATATYAASAGYTTIGAGYLDGTTHATPAIHKGDDGYTGDLGAVIIVRDGIISGANLTKLHTWSRSTFGAAA